MFQNQPTVPASYGLFGNFPYAAFKLFMVLGLLLNRARVSWEGVVFVE
jgi:hypothetical protein